LECDVAIPDYESLMLPVLRQLAEGREVHMSEMVAAIGSALALNDEELREMLPSGVATRFGNRVGWAKTYLKQAGLLEQPRRGVVRITDRGRQVLARSPSRVDNAVLAQFAEFEKFRKRSRVPVAAPDATQAARGATLDQAPAEPPMERLESAAKELSETLTDELLAAVRNCSPAYFESLVVQLLLKMGYGGSRQEAGQAVGRSGDGGIDGVISEDRLGLDTIYVQAKRWQAAVGEPQIRDFLGALVGRGASKGVFITTSSFTEQSRQFAARSLQQRIVLIDGERLAELMIEHDLGVSTAAIYRVKRVDSDYFVEE
jgi:restriction system protein